jgi:AMMECR1 domain-containing protein
MGSGFHPLVSLVRAAVETWITSGRVVDPQHPAPSTQHPSGLFVSIKAFGELRGSAGALRLERADPSAEVVRYALAAAREDERFNPVTPDELPFLSYAVDLLGEPQPGADVGSWGAPGWALLVESDGRYGLLLPGRNGAELPAPEVKAALVGSGVAPGAPAYRIPVQHLAEPEFDRVRPPVDDDE